MIHRIASILKDRIAAFTYVDKIGGLTRVARQQREGREIVIPVAGDVDEAYACDPATVRDMVPDDRYGCIVYFEDRGTTRETSRTRGTFYSASLRLVCWVNTAKFGSDPNAADRILEQFTNDLNVGQPYNTDTLIGLKHIVSGIPQRGASIFSQYTYPEAARQYLLWPFDAFALDITANYRIKPGCEEAPVPDDDACWTAPVTSRRRHPSEFTCDELTDPVNGLTPAQLGPECLNCTGEIPCDPTTVNGTESTTPTILVQQGGVEVGTLDPITGVHTVPECDPCEDAEVTFATIPLLSIPSGDTEDIDCDTPLDAVVVSGATETQKNGTYTPSATVNGRTSYDLAPNHVIEWDGSQYINRDIFVGTDWITNNAPATPWAGVWVEFVGGAPIDGTVAQATIGTFCATPCEDVTVQLRDSAANNIGSPDVYPAGTTTTKTAPDASWTLKDQDGNTLGSGAIASGGAADIVAPDAKVQLLDSAGNNIGSANSYLSGSINNLTAPDGTVLRDGAPYGFVKSNGSIDVPSNIPAGDPIIYAFGPELWSGQSSSFRTGDEQSIRAAGWFDYTPSFGSSSQKQYLVNWLTLGVNNHFGNTNRFTDATGAAYGTTGDRTFIDHLTKLQWFVPNDPTLTAVWNTAIDAALASSADGHTDWKVPPIQVWYSVALYNSGSVLNYGPFNIATAIIPWSSTTSPASTAQALRMTNALGAASATNKTSATQHGIFVRRWAP